VLQQWILNNVGETPNPKPLEKSSGLCLGQILPFLEPWQLHQALVELAIGEQENYSSPSGGHFEKFLDVVGPILGAFYTIFARTKQERNNGMRWMEDHALQRLRLKISKDSETNQFPNFSTLDTDEMMFKPPYFLAEKTGMEFDVLASTPNPSDIQKKFLDDLVQFFWTGTANLLDCTHDEDKEHFKIAGSSSGLSHSVDVMKNLFEKNLGRHEMEDFPLSNTKKYCQEINVWYKTKKSNNPVGGHATAVMSLDSKNKNIGYAMNSWGRFKGEQWGLAQFEARRSPKDNPLDYFQVDFSAPWMLSLETLAPWNEFVACKHDFKCVQERFESNKGSSLVDIV
jgi:hypothetical protein